MKLFRDLPTLLLGALCLASPHRLPAGEVLGISIASLAKPIPAAAGGNSGAAVFSAEGRHVVFLSTAANLTTNSVNDLFTDVFRRELASGTTTLVSLPTATGTSGNGPVTAFSSSANGRWIAFSSRASNLVHGDTNAVEDLFLRDLDANLTLRISQAQDGGAANGESGGPIISPDGRFILFESAASNLVAASDTNRSTDVFLWEKASGITTLVSSATNGMTGNRSSSAVLISDDGNRILFRSAATDLVRTNRAITTDLFLWTRSAGTLLRVELPGTPPGASQLPVATYNPVLSADGRFLAFRTRIDSTAVAPYEGVWWFDLEQGTRTQVSGGLFVRWPVGYADSSGPVMARDGQRLAFEAQTNGTGPSRILVWSPIMGLKTLDEMVSPQPPTHAEPVSSVSPVLSRDGTFLAFETDAAVPAAGVATSGTFRLYLRDLATGETRTPFPAEPVESDLPSPVFSPGGDFVLFQTASVLPGIEDSNASEDVFVAPVNLDRVELISQRHPDMPLLTGSATSILEPAAVSHDGRLVAFVSHADNLTFNDTNGRRDVFVRDQVTGTNVLVSVGLDGHSPKAESWQPRMSSGGRHIAFVSTATNLVPGDTNPVSAVFVRNMATGETVLASARDQSDEKGNRFSLNPQISANGEWVLFESSSTNLVTGWTVSATRLYLRHLPTRRTVLVSGNLVPSSHSESSGSFGAAMDSVGNRIVLLSGLDAYLYSVPTDNLLKITPATRTATISLSQDGSRIAFLGSSATNSSLGAVYWRDLNTATNHLIASAISTTENRFSNVSISGDGRKVTFESNIVPTGFRDTNGTSDVFVFDLASGALSRVSSSAAGDVAGNASSGWPVPSTDGQLVAFRSYANDLIEGDTNRSGDVFVSNLATGEVQLLSRRSTDGSPGNAGSFRPLLSGDGHVSVFQSAATDLVAGDFNQSADVLSATLLGGLVGSIPFNPPAVMTLRDSPLALPTISNRGMPILYEMQSGPASLSGNKLGLISTGTVVIRATEVAGDGTFGEAVTRTFSVAKEPQIITWMTPQADTVLRLHHPYLLTATASSGMPATVRVGSGPAFISNGNVIVTNVGTVVLVAEQGGNSIYAYAQTLRVFNRLSIETPHLGQWPGMPRGEATDVFVQDERAYVTLGRAGLAIFDVSNPVSPVRLGGFDTSGTALAVQVVDNLAYVMTDGYPGLQILDVANPAEPSLLGGINRFVQGVQVRGNLAYVADGLSLLFYDVSNPATPKYLGGHGVIGSARGVQVVNNIAYVAADTGGLRMYDVSAPPAYVPLGFFDTSGSAVGVHVVDNLAYVLDKSGGIQILDVSNPSAPALLGGIGSTHALDVHVADKIAFVADELFGLRVFDVRDPQNPIELGGFDSEGQLKAVTVMDKLAYVADGSGGLLVLDAQDPTSPIRLGSYNTQGWTSAVEIVGERVYLADGNSLQLLDAKDPSNPVRVGGAAAMDWITSVQVVGDVAYLPDREAGLQLLDVGNPAAPERLGNFDAVGSAAAVQVVGDLAYVAGQAGGLHILDVSDPTGPVRLGGYDTTGIAKMVQIVGSLAFIADDHSGLQILDVSNPSTPVRLGGFDTTRLVHSVQVVGNHAFLADDSNGLQILDVSNPVEPRFVSDFRTSDAAMAIEVVDNLAYVAAGIAGLQILDVSNPSAPVLVGSYDTSGTALGVRVKGNTAYVADGEWGLQVLGLRERRIVQTLAFNVLGVVALEEGPLSLTATASSGLPVAFAVVSGPATVAGNQLILTGTGTVVVRAEQVDDTQFLPISLQRSITVILSEPVFTTAPSSRSVPLGGTVSFAVTATGITPLSYQWRLNGVALAGATNAALTLPGVTLADGGTYTVVVANEAGSVESAPALLELEGLPPLVMVDDFASRQVFTVPSFLGATSNLIATGQTNEPRHAGKVGGKSLWLAWRAPASGVVTFRTVGSGFDTLLAVYTGTALDNLVEVTSDEDRGGFLTSELRFNAVAGTDYQVAVDGFAGAAGLVVLGWELDAAAPVLPILAGQPADVLTRAGQPVNFQVNAAPVGVSYQWSFNGQPLPGANNPTLTLPAVIPAQAGQYRVQVTAPSGATIESRDALLEVAAATDGELGGLSAEKLADLFADDSVGAGGGRAAKPSGAGFTSLTLGVPGTRFLNLARSLSDPSDPVPCDVIVTASRWLRFRAEAPGTIIRLATTNAALDTVLAVFTNRFTPALIVCNDNFSGGRNSQVTFTAAAEVDYLVMVAAKGTEVGVCGVAWLAAASGVTAADNPLGLDVTDIQDGHFTFRRVVLPGVYQIDRGSAMERLAPLQRLRVRSGLLDFLDPEPVTDGTRFYRFHLTP
jgi:hypothetical protein